MSWHGALVGARARTPPRLERPPDASTTATDPGARARPPEPSGLLPRRRSNTNTNAKASAGAGAVVGPSARGGLAVARAGAGAPAAGRLLLLLVLLLLLLCEARVEGPARQPHGLGRAEGGRRGPRADGGAILLSRPAAAATTAKVPSSLCVLLLLHLLVGRTSRRGEGVPRGVLGRLWASASISRLGGLVMLHRWVCLDLFIRARRFLPLFPHATPTLDSAAWSRKPFGLFGIPLAPGLISLRQ
mmetsp:Transcript_76746/g.167700  ORF Transcript_76746/g.167700 Transcript_76746/m.167700 type:complete len:245 (+) Transcript_76746:219-953(+)